MSQIRTNSIVPAGGLAGNGGGPIQIVQTVKQDSFSASVSRYNPAAITGLSASITPSSTNSKVLVTFSVNTSMEGTNGAPAVSLYRGGSALSGAQGTVGFAANHTATACFAYSNDLPAGSVGMTYLDSPATTSSTTYQCYLTSDQTGNYTVGVNRNNSNSRIGYISAITLMEISG